MLRRQISRLLCLRCSGTYSKGGGTPDPSGLYEKGKAQENIYIRKKESEDLVRLKKRLHKVEQDQAALQDKLDQAVDLLDQLKKMKDEKTKK